MKVLVWQWGRYGAGPRYAMELARGLRAVEGVQAVLSLSRRAEIMENGLAECDLPMDTYTSLGGWGRRMVTIPFEARSLAQRLRKIQPDVAICAMPAALDLLMATALRRVGVPFATVVHDATLHPGDVMPFQMVLQNMLLRRADALVALSRHVATQLQAQGRVGNRPLLSATLSPFTYGPAPPPPRAHGGRLRLLSFGRLLPYKGLDLLAEALRRLGAGDYEVRVVGAGPESATLDALRRLPGVTVENRWVPEEAVGALLAWSDALVLSHREASQSGVAAAALEAGRWVVATDVGGLSEQLRDAPCARLCAPDAASLAAAIGSLFAHPPASGQAREPSLWRRSVANLASQLATMAASPLPPAE